MMTGWDGYIGSHLKPYLENKGFDIVPFIGPIRDFSFYTGIPDMVIHLAALTGVRKSITSPEQYGEVNVWGFRKVAHLCASLDTPLLFASSSNAKDVTNPYAQTKLMNEQESPPNSVGFRPHTVYPGRPDMLYQRLLKDEVKYINAKHYRDFTHIEDLCSAIHTIIKHYNTLVGSVVDIGSGESVSVLKVAESMGFVGEVRYDDTPSERETTCADINTLVNLGWKPERQILHRPERYYKG